MTKQTPIYNTPKTGIRPVVPRPAAAAPLTKKAKGAALSVMHTSEDSGQSAWLDYSQRRLRTAGKKADAVQLLEVKLMKDLYDGRKHS